MKVTKKILMIIMFAVILLNLVPEQCMAISVTDILQGANSFLDYGKQNGNNLVQDSDIEGFTVPLANILTAAGTVILVGAFIVLGIKYMFATPEEAAKLKQQLIGLCVAGAVIFGAVLIWRIAYEIMESVETSLK